VWPVTVAPPQAWAIIRLALTRSIQVLQVCVTLSHQPFILIPTIWHSMKFKWTANELIGLSGTSRRAFICIHDYYSLYSSIILDFIVFIRVEQQRYGSSLEQSSKRHVNFRPSSWYLQQNVLKGWSPPRIFTVCLIAHFASRKSHQLFPFLIFNRSFSSLFFLLLFFVMLLYINFSSGKNSSFNHTEFPPPLGHGTTYNRSEKWCRALHERQPK
jgi:hypothetical protein